jgi:hypothetical protein
MICVDCNGEGVALQYEGGIVVADEAYEMCPTCKGLGVTDFIFVFGSNEAGIHGAGAALIARTEHGAILAQGYGRQGRSFAIPTKGKINLGGGWGIGRPLPLGDINGYVGMFAEYAEQQVREHFKVTLIGTGHAGFKHEQMAPMFADCPKNCFFDKLWKPWLGDKHLYWGTYGG